MSVIIKFSYTDDSELAGAIKMLHPAVKSYKVKPAKGRHKLAYIDIKSDVLCAVFANKKQC